MLVTLVLCTARALTASAIGGPSEKFLFNIDAGVAAQRLNEFGTQSRMQLVFNFEDMQDVEVSAVRGALKPKDALNMMLKGTPITYQFLNRKTLAFQRVAREVRSPKPIRPRADSSKHGKIDRRSAGAGLEEVTISSGPPSLLDDTGAPLITVSRTDIDAAGFITAQDVVRTLPQVFGGGPSEDTQLGPEAGTNAARGAGVNLRGLGAGSTLVLMNGSRLASGGSEGLFVDVSNLPLAAVERIDILPDNSSTFYGADAVGGVVNFVMREEFTGRQTEAFFGNSTRGQLGENYVSQIIGGHTDSGHGLLALDFYSRDNLTAASRRQAHSDLRSFGGSNFDSERSGPGNIVYSPDSWAIPKGQDGTGLTPASFQRGTVNLQDRYEGADILPSQQRWSAFGTWRQNLTDRLSFYGDALFGQRNIRGNGTGQPGLFLVQPTNAFYVNPTGVPGPVAVEYNFLDDLGPQLSEARVQSLEANGGLELRFGSEWHARISAGYTSEAIRSSLENQVSAAALATALASGDPEKAFNPFGDGSHTYPAVLESLRASSLLTTRSIVRSIGAMVRGPVIGLPGGDVMLTFGGDQREQSFGSLNLSDATLVPTHLKSAGERSIHSVFAELQLPIVGPENRHAGIEALSLSAAQRIEDYSDFGRAHAPRFGLAWAPLSGVTIRSTYSESFRPPGLLDLDESGNAYAFAPLRDPVTGGNSMVLIWAGNNRDLREENARSWTAGIEIEPPQHQGTALAVTYFSTVFSDRLNQPDFTADLLSNPADSALITRDPSSEYRADVCSRAPQTGSAVGNCLTTPISAIVDLRLRNDAIVHTRGFDVLARYAKQTSLGRFSLSLNGTYILDFAEARAAGLPLADRVSTPSYPIDIKVRGGLRWQLGGFDVSANVSYLNGYDDTASAPARHVKPWTTVDLRGAYTLDAPAQSWLGNTTLSLGIDNAFDSDPPFVNNAVGIGYDQENGDLIGRTLSFSVRKKW
ncbi:MAG: TonB-dependent receptor [Gammaproteobacteria bacterium]